jgi:nucleotide-binding universal stress UspA family protein
MPYRRILVPIDGSEASGEALAVALRLARENGGRVRVLHRFDALNYLTGFECSTQALADAQAFARRVVDQAIEAGRGAGVPCDGTMVEPMAKGLGDTVADEARAWQADLIVVGTARRQGLGRAVMGSGAEDILRHAPVPVMAIRAPEAVA